MDLHVKDWISIGGRSYEVISLEDDKVIVRINSEMSFCKLKEGMGVEARYVGSKETANFKVEAITQNNPGGLSWTSITLCPV